jgi:hypothetical protein
MRRAKLSNNEVVASEEEEEEEKEEGGGGGGGEEKEEEEEYFKVVHSVHFLDHCTQFIAPTKCTVLIIYKY